MASALIVGKPNAGKSLLFNRLTGLKQKVANFPGVTVQIKKGSSKGIDYVDYPGIYSFEALTKDEEVAIEKFKEMADSDEVKVIMCVLDATRLERSVSMGIQAQQLAAEKNKAFIFVLNMMDEVLKVGQSIDVEGLAKKLGSPVFPVSARLNTGINELQEALASFEQLELYVPSKNESRTGKNLLSFSREIRKEFGLEPDLFIKNQNRIDRFFLSSWAGGILFGLIMLIVFQSIFTWAEPLMDGTESIILWLNELVLNFIPKGVFADFVSDALFGGIGAFLVFVPQIFILSFIIGLLEDSGYLARAAIICHRPLGFFGLSGKSFIPYLSGHACAIPAIMATRTIESPKKRFLTLLTVPLTACSARLPVYALLITAFIPTSAFLGGLIGSRGLALFALYFFGIFTALIVAFVVDRFSGREKDEAPFIMELPPYRLPHFKPLFFNAFNSAKSFVVKAGGMIFSVTVIVWLLSYFPNGSGNLNESYLGTIGQAIEPVFAPMGLDWKVGVAILTSFLAREVFVGTLGTFFGIEGADENIGGMAERLQSGGMEPAAGLALLVFYAIALQCVSTLAVIKGETGSYKTPILAFLGYSIAAYILAVLTYQVLV